MKDSVCVGVVGAGIISDIYLKNMTEKFKNLRIKAVSARNIKKAQEKADRYGISACSVDAMMEDPVISPRMPWSIARLADWREDPRNVSGALPRKSFFSSASRHSACAVLNASVIVFSV